MRNGLLPDGSAEPLSVLLVDDEAMLLEVTARLLRAAGIVVTTCSSGESAAERLRTERFDVVVSDLAMPGMGGIGLLTLMRARDVDVPVVLLTGSPTLDSAMKAVEHGAFKYLTKPVEREELIATIRRAARDAELRGGTRRRDVASSDAVDRRSVEPGSLLGERYRLRRPLGVGGMGEVWEAAHLLTSRLVALKLLHPGLNARPEMRRRLLREARAATAFAHPNAVEVFDLFELADGTPVIVMELLRGETLRARLDRSGIASVPDICGVMAQVVSALGTAHANGVIHRDVKPENVMLCEPLGTPKVMDFGIAKLVHADPSEATSGTVAGVAVGTLGYMAPEQACGDSHVDHRADVWSLGAVLYESFCGARPHSGTTLGQVIAQHLTEQPVPLTTRAPTVPVALAHLIDRMLARRPDGRPSDLREVHAELLRHTAIESPVFGPPGATASVDHGPSEEARHVLGSALTELPPPVRRRSA